ncbi:MAG: helix-turn-helix transcriptional regulator [Proteobacteria bacterium]|nr:helix-turn-helix transcriptional regulator [Pseudomonadota bacterium]
MMGTVQPVGELLRTWRQRRRMSQLDLALEAEISTRHLSFVETGRAQPSREMVLRLAEQLEVPLRERNTLLVAAGFAPVYGERALDDPAMQAAHKAIALVLAGHEPCPALAVDRHWTLLAANRALAPLLAGVDAALLRPPVNVLRVSLHPSGLAPRIANLAEWRAHVLHKLSRQVGTSGDPVLRALHDELAGFPAPEGAASPDADPAARHGGVAVPFRLATGAGVLSFLSTTTIFGTPTDITLSEIAIESFFPADAATEAILRAGLPA